MNNYTKTTRKIGRNRGKPRLWIEGRALVEAGLPHGSAWILVNHIMGVDIVDLEYAPEFGVIHVTRSTMNHPG